MQKIDAGREEVEERMNELAGRKKKLKWFDLASSVYGRLLGCTE